MQPTNHSMIEYKPTPPRNSKNPDWGCFILWTEKVICLEPWTSRCFNTQKHANQRKKYHPYLWTQRTRRSVFGLLARQRVYNEHTWTWSSRRNSKRPTLRTQLAALPPKSRGRTFADRGQPTASKNERTMASMPSLFLFFRFS